jgi:ABC-type multidrug transport system fused ATPase/permease subunit
MTAIAKDAATKENYADYRRRHVWLENSLAASDEDESGDFSIAMLRRFVPYLARYRTQVVWSAIFMVLFTALNVANPFLIGYAVDLASQGNLTGMIWMSAALLVVNVAMWQAQYWQIWLMSWAGEQMLYDLSGDMFEHLQQLSLGFYDRTQIGRVMSRLQSDIDVLETMLSSGLLSMVSSVLALSGIIVIMLVMNWQLALATFVVLPVMAFIAVIWQRSAQKSFRRTRAAISLVNSTLQENLSGMRVIQSLVREDRNFTQFSDLNEYNRDTNIDASRIAALVLPLVEVVAAVATALAIFVGGLLVSNHALTIGVLVAFTLYINRFFDPIRDLSQQYTQLQRSGVAAERIFQLMDIPVEIEDHTDAIDLPQIQGAVDFNNVHFGYLPNREVLHGLNLHVPAGTTLAIVGPTGAGKSTIAGLLTRFYEVQGGQVLIDGHDVKDVTQHSLRSQIGVVLQEPFLFTGTIADNIRYGRLEATQEEVEAAADAVGAHDLIIQMPDGYDTPIRERGRNLSVGQRQLISFARAFLANPRILIMDEATANVDTLTEVIVQQGVRKLLRNRTALIIAHRLSTIKGADQIIVLQGGLIAEQGTHEDLLARGGEYARLYAMGFRETAAGAS